MADERRQAAPLEGPSAAVDAFVHLRGLSALPRPRFFGILVKMAFFGKIGQVKCFRFLPLFRSNFFMPYLDEYLENLRPTIKKIVEKITRSYYYQWGYEFDPEDVFQDFLIYLPSKIHLFDGNIDSFPAWCYVVARNYVKGIYRRKKREARAYGEYAEMEQSQADIPRIIEQISAPLREEMDTFICWYDEAIRSNANHFPSVIWLRLRIVIDVIHDCRQPEKFVPWYSQEESWRFQPIWPTIQDIWQATCDKHPINTREIADTINSQWKTSGQTNRINAGYWNSQVARSVDKVNDCTEFLPIMRYFLDRKAPAPHLRPADD